MLQSQIRPRERQSLQTEPYVPYPQKTEDCRRTCCRQYICLRNRSNPFLACPPRLLLHRYPLIYTLNIASINSCIALNHPLTTIRQPCFHPGTHSDVLVKKTVSHSSLKRERRKQGSRLWSSLSGTGEFPASAVWERCGSDDGDGGFA